MAEAAAPGAGQALRVYQLLFVLAVGFLAGRVPALFEAGRTETAELARALDPNAAAPAGRPPPAAEEAGAAPSDLPARIAAQVAARVAADVADATIARLLAAGWGPPETRGDRPTPAAGPARAVSPAAPAETVVRVVAEVRPPDAGTLSTLGWRLAPPASGPEGGGRHRPAPPTPAPRRRRGPDRRPARARACDRCARLRAAAPRRAAGGRRIARPRACPRPRGGAGPRLGRRSPPAQTSVAGLHLQPRARGYRRSAGRLAGAGRRPGRRLARLRPRPPCPAADLGIRPGHTRSRARRRARPRDGRGGPRPSLAAASGVPMALDLERRFALGALARNAWAARISGGASGRLRVGPRPLLWDGWGEAGIVGAREADVHAGGQVRAGVPVLALGRVSLDAGAGVWAAGQRTGETAVGRLDIGPSARFSDPSFPFQAQIDWRVRALGRAEPGTGLALTVSGNF